MKPVLIFDFDGTICDSKKIGLEIFRKCIAEHSGMEINDEMLEKFFMSNVFVSSFKLLKHKFYLIPRIFEAYALAAKEEILHAEMFDGMKEILIELAKKYRMAIVTSNSNIVVNKFLNKYGIRDCFLGVYGFEDGRSKKNKLKYCMEKFHVPAEKILFFTDTVNDIKEATAVNVNVVGCSWGYHSKEILEKSKAMRVIDYVKQIKVVVKQYHK